jgi:hypothetical protein
MSRHVIAGRFGGGDRAGIPKAKDEVLTRLNLVSGQKRIDHGIGHALDDLNALGLVPSELGLDLLVLAAHVHAADTRISRWTESQDAWTREIRLVVPVSDLPKWSAVAPILERMLNFLTGDRWTIGFRRRPRGFAKSVPGRLNGVVGPEFDGINLFSGGLDSLIGAIDALEARRAPLFVSHAGEGATSAAQRVLFEALEKHYRKQTAARLRVWMSFGQELVKKVAGEDTTRGRSFLFFALGIFAGTALGTPFTLRAPENGLIALNVPLDPLRLGALSTRTTHPFYVARWNELLQALGIDARIENPYWNKTKGEMASECANARLLEQLVPLSLSCSSPAKARWQRIAAMHCGHCLPCLIRRASLETALGRGQDPTAYSVPDLRAGALDTRRAAGQQVRSFQLAIERLRRRPGIADILIHKPGPLRDEIGRLDELANVYRRGLEEVGTLLSGVQTTPA